MPLFPIIPQASDQNKKDIPKLETRDETTSGSSWLTNNSFSASAAAVIQKRHEKHVQKVASFQPVDDICVPQDSKPIVLDSDGSEIYSQDSETIVLDSDDSSTSSKKRKKKEKRKKKHKKKKKEEKDEIPPQKETPKSLDPLSGKVFIEQIFGLTPKHAYRTDRKPDPYNWSFGCIYKLNIAKYRRLTDKSMAKPYEDTIPMNEKKQNGGIDWRYYNKKGRIAMRQLTFDSSAPPSDKEKNQFSNSDNKTQNFIALNAQKSAKKTFGVQLQSNPLGVYDTATASWAAGYAPVEEEVEEKEKTLEELALERTKAKTAEFNKALNANPHDIPLWKKFLDFQNEANGGNSRAVIGRKETAEEARVRATSERAILEIKMAIIERAIKENPYSIELKIMQLEMYTGLEDRLSLVDRWKELIDQNKQDPNIWKQFVKYLCSNATVFTVSEMQGIFTACISYFREDLTALPENCLSDIFLDLCSRLHLAGHHERVFALFQLQTELNVFCPDVLKKEPFVEKLEYLEMFWSAGVKRFGEDGAAGWEHYVNCSGNVEPSATYNEVEENKIEDAILSETTTSGLAQRWLSLETMRDCRQLLPWRPDLAAGQIEENCEDIERLVSFETVSGCLFECPDVKQQWRIIKAMLVSLGLKIDALDLDLINLFSAKLDDNIHIVKPEVVEFDCSHLAESLVINALKQSRDRFLDTNIRSEITLILLQSISYYAMRQCENTPKDSLRKEIRKNAKKEFKEILKEKDSRGDLLLWKEYIKLEASLGNAKDVRTVIDSALALGLAEQKLTDGNIAHSFALCSLVTDYLNYELALKTSERYQDKVLIQQILHVTSSIALQSKFTPLKNGGNVPLSTLLRARKTYISYMEDLAVSIRQNGRRKSLSSAHAQLFRHWSNLFAHLQLYSIGIDAAMNVFQRARNLIEQISPEMTSRLRAILDSALEDLAQDNVALQCHYTQFKSVAMTTQRALLHVSLARFPSNEFMLKKLVALETKSFACNQLRRFFTRTCAQADLEIVWKYAIISELRRLQTQRSNSVGIETESGLSHRIRSLFERALSRDSFVTSLPLWRMYLHFENFMGDDDRLSAVIYRALRNCPYAKCLYFDAVRFRSGAATMLSEMVDLLTEKELRVRTPLEEIDPRFGYAPKAETEAIDLLEDLDDDLAPADTPMEAAGGANFTPLVTPQAAEKCDNFTPLDTPQAKQACDNFTPLDTPQATEKFNSFAPLDTPQSAEKCVKFTTLDTPQAKQTCDIFTPFITPKLTENRPVATPEPEQT